MRHRTAARMSVLTDAIVISVSARRAVVNVYVHGKSYEIQPVTTIMSSVNQLVATLQTTRSVARSLPAAPDGPRARRLRYARRHYRYFFELRDHAAGKDRA